MIMKNSSNSTMEHVFNLLANIQTAEPSRNLHSKTLKKLQRQTTIPLFWVSVAACLLIAFISTEFYIATFKNNTTKEDISMLITKTNNILYHE